MPTNLARTRAKVSIRGYVVYASLKAAGNSDAHRIAGVDFLVGFETEFILLKKTSDGSIQTVNQQPWASTRATLTGSPEAACMEGIVHALEGCGIVVEMYHSEATQGQVRSSLFVRGRSRPDVPV
jgi:glutamine synthetase